MIEVYMTVKVANVEVMITFEKAKFFYLIYLIY